MKKQLMKKQQGMTITSWMFVVAIVGFFFMMAIRIGPVFAEDLTISSIWDNLENEPSLVGESPKNIRKSVMKKFAMNNIKVLKKGDIKITRDKGYYIVKVEYEPRGKIIGKLDFIATFKHEAKIRAK
ncbi:MAG: DUF4845 domain-containing protein [Gammaproteobacteria bacterium]|nr:DUF4845 domain-containing protein [Gammaproteobacteria bacterium]MCK5262112.1 DUF4845 domain-containing protein [Gammaproteobacteria bacterium]